MARRKSTPSRSTRTRAETWLRRTAGINQMIRIVKLGATIAERDRRAGRGRRDHGARLPATKSFEGYWQRPEADAKALRDGWYFTGDTGYADEDGDIYVTGRVDDMIITGGENVSPVEIESCLSLHPAVSEVAVVGLPDERWGKIVAAFIKRRARDRPTELDEHCRDLGARQFQAAAPLRLCSTTSRNLPSASFCAASSSRANTRPKRHAATAT